VLVTGGAGYIGAHTVQTLSERGHEPVVLDDLSTGRPAAVGDAPLITGDCGDASLLDSVLGRGRFDAVIHFAALKSVEESVAHPLRYFAHNVGKTLALLDAMQRASLRVLVYSSSAAVYGAPDDLPVSEVAPLRPMNAYGESKRLVELALGWLAAAGAVQSAALRYFNAGGAADDGSIGEDWSQATNLIPLTMKAVLGAGPPLRVFGTDYPTPDGTAIRDYVHVVDLADAHVRAMEALVHGASSMVLNLGTGHGASVAEVIAATERASRRSVPVEFAARRPGDMAAIWADCSRAAETLGWHATRGLDEIISSAWRWHSHRAS
jgi:UDP-glucose-4-epimerase GalE